MARGFFLAQYSAQTASPAFLLALEKPDEAGEFRNVQIGNAGERETVLSPGDFVVTVRIKSRGRSGFYDGPDEDVDSMQPAAIDERGHRPAPRVIDASACERKTLLCKVGYRRRERKLPIEPWLYRMAVARHNIHLAAHESPLMS